jgi:hypothetical protein
MITGIENSICVSVSKTIMDSNKVIELKNSLAEIRETAELLELKLDKFLHETDPDKMEAMRKLIESAINLLQFEFKRTILMETGELKDYFSDI